ncbi:MAG TPA: DUF4105 domain-containing protein [Polyangiaceae bacterium]|nr:DUF4105 domain-containing protein [Polyangiaceae bacterium]
MRLAHLASKYAARRTVARAAAVLAFARVISSVTTASALEAPAASEGYRISVITMGPGDAFVSYFGHDAFLVERAGLPALVYNFGTYTEQAIAPHHVLGGTLLYYLSVDYFEHTLRIYRAQNRTVIQQVLALDAATAESLAMALSKNSRPQNTTYHYDFALDNCTTRVRDLIDRELHGALRRQLDRPSPYSYRDHALRFTARDLALSFLFDLGLGKPADRRLDAWDDAFLPDRLAAYLRRATVTNAAGTHPLVAREATLFAAKRAPVPERPPMREPYYAFAGAMLGTLLIAAGSRPALRVAFGLACAAVGAFVGAAGVFVLLLLGTHVHPASHRNFNALVCPAWALLLVPAGFRLAFGKSAPWERASFLAASSLLLAVAGTVVALGSGQASQRVAMLSVPLLTGAWLGVRRARRVV